MKILFYSIHQYDKSILESANSKNIEMQFTELSLNENTTNLVYGFDAVSLFTSDSATETILEKLFANGVRYIALRSVGSDHIALAKAKSLGMKVANVPAYSPYSVAEHAVTLLLALNRKIVFGQQLMNHGNFELDQLVGVDIHKKTVGIIGTGKIGGAFAKIMNGFGCRLLAYDLIEDQTLIKETNIKYASLETVCQHADIISIHCPLNSFTKYLFNELVFQFMKKGMILINTARGGIINTEDLLTALDNGTISATGLDVYENEKKIFGNDHKAKRINDDLFARLRSYPNVLLTGHQAFLTQEALLGIATTTFENLALWSEGKTCENELF